MPYASNHGVRIHYEVEGDGPPLVLLHGTADGLQGWRETGFVDGLKDDHRLVLIDQRGHGQSDKPHDVAAYDWLLLVDDVTGVLNDLAITSADVLGYSAGSFIALAMAMSAPERVRSLILGGASAKWPGVSARALDMFAESMDAFVRFLVESAGPLLWDIQRVLANDPVAVSASLSAPRCTPSPDMLRAFDKPCLIFVGEADPRLADSHEMASHLSDATLATLPGLNHVQTYARSDLVLPHIRAFLAQVEHA
jgi:pimeloyl-ACP methyl ester carboxylesterase